MKLYTAKASPFGRTVEITAHELGLHEDLEIVATSVGPTRPNAEFQRIAPLRKIPALVTEEGALVADSTVICEYLAARVGDTRIFARDAANHFEVMTRYFLAKGAADCAVAARYETAVRPAELRWQAFAQDQIDKIVAVLAHYDAAPPEAGGRVTIGDIGLGATLGYLDFRFADIGWRERFPALASWFDRLDARPSFAATRPA